jgi:cysteine desulfurase
MSLRSYLDHNASAPLRPEARRAMIAWLEEQGGNASSVHTEGRASRARLEDARRTIAASIGGQAGGLIFTGSATEANNLALKGVAQGPMAQERNRVLATGAAHPSVLEPVRWIHENLLEMEGGILPVDRHGKVLREALTEALTERTLVLSVIGANNETGVLESIEELAHAAHGVGAWLHVDASQCLGRVAVDVEAWGADLVTLSAHKAGGPQGIGALWVREGVQLSPLHHGGHQERNRRGGTEDVLAAIGFAAAARAALEALDVERVRQEALITSLWSSIANDIPDAVRIAGDVATLPNTLLTAFPGAEGETLLIGLDLEGVSASSGSACTAGSLEPSHVLLAMGLEPRVAGSALRFSVGPETDAEDIARVCRVLPLVVARARGNS